LQVPSLLQRLQKVYVDWEMMLSTMKKSQAFAGRHSSLDTAGMVESVRQMALKAPKAICNILYSMGCIQDSSSDVFVLVKEGTREVDNHDWKISFHFVFQIIASVAQFQCVYEMIMHSVCCMPGPRHLAFLMGLISLRDYEASIQAGMECAGCDEQGRRDYAFNEIVKASLCCATAGWGDEAAAALLGVDMHPAKNAFQGLACLGSKKKAGGTGNRLAGMMRVHGEGGSDWMPGYCSNAHPLLVLAEASVIMPGPRCIGLAPMERWLAQQGLHLRGCDEECLAKEQPIPLCDESLQAALQRVAASEGESMRGLLLRLQGMQGPCMQHCGSSYARGIGCVTGVVGKTSQMAGSKRLSEALGSAGRAREDVFFSVPEWFRACCRDMYKESGGMGLEHAFRTANTSMQNISRPCVVNGRDESASIVHVSRTEVCMCMLSLMEIPFKVPLRPFFVHTNAHADMPL